MTRRQQTMRAAQALIVFLAAAFLALAPAEGAPLSVRAEPDRVATGSGGAAIIVEVRAASGEAARDGTQVQFATTLGTITPVAQTVNGVARGVITSQATGTAQVSVLVGGDRANVFVEFVAGSASVRSDSRVVRVTGGYVGYSVECQLFIASDQAKLEVQGLEISADSLQYDLARNLVRAQHLVRVRGVGAALEGERLSFYVASQTGVLIRSGSDQGLEKLWFQGATLAPQPENASLQQAFQPLEAQDTRTWIISRQATVFPAEKIQFLAASMYANDVHLFDLPIYVLRLSGYGTTGNYLDQVFSLNSDGGLSVDVPLYYAASEHRTAALHLRRVAPNSYGAYSGPGWSLGIVEQYERGRSLSGTLALNNLSESTRGFRWDHHQQLGVGSRFDLFFNHQRYSTDSPGISTGYGYFFRRFKDAGLTVSMQATRYGGTTDLASDLAYRWDGRKLAHTDLGYDLSLRAGYGQSPSDNPYYYYVSAPGRQFYYGLGAGLYPPGKDLDHRTNLSTSVTAQSDWFLDGGTRNSLEARAMMRRTLGTTSSASLTYSYSLRRGDWSGGVGPQRLDLNVFASKGQVWNLFAYVSKNLTQSSLFGSANLSYQLPLQRRPDGTSPWRFEATATSSRYQTISLTDTRFALGRDLGSYELLLCYSPQGSGGYGPYGYASGGTGKKFWLELGASRW